MGSPISYSSAVTLYEQDAADQEKEQERKLTLGLGRLVKTAEQTVNTGNISVDQRLQRLGTAGAILRGDGDVREMAFNTLFAGATDGQKHAVQRITEPAHPGFIPVDNDGMPIAMKDAVQRERELTDEIARLRPSGPLSLPAGGTPPTTPPSTDPKVGEAADAITQALALLQDPNKVKSPNKVIGLVTGNSSATIEQTDLKSVIEQLTDALGKLRPEQVPPGS